LARFAWISSHSNIRAPTAALEADALAGFFAVVLATKCGL
jgi:hypothetical protein